MKIIMPFSMLWVGFKILVLTRPQRNGLKTNENVKKLTAYKNATALPGISTELIKKRAKELSTPDAKITFNDVLMTALSKTLYDYLQ